MQKRRLTQFKKRDKSQVSNETVDSSRSNKSDKVKSLDKSRSTQKTDTENTVNAVDKVRFISRTGLSYKSSRIENPK